VESGVKEGPVSAFVGAAIPGAGTGAASSTEIVGAAIPGSGTGARAASSTEIGRFESLLKTLSLRPPRDTAGSGIMWYLIPSHKLRDKWHNPIVTTTVTRNSRTTDFARPRYFVFEDVSILSCVGIMRRCIIAR